MMKKELTSFVEGFLEHRKEENRARERLRLKALEEVTSLQSFFDTLPGVKRVYAFGSVCDTERFTPYSDIDLAFERLPSEYLCRVLAHLVSKLSFNPEVLILEDIRPELVKAINRKGILIYERKSSNSGTSR